MTYAWKTCPKECVQSTVDGVVILFDKLIEEIQRARNDMDLSDTGKQKRINRLKEQFGRRIDDEMIIAASFVDSIKKKLDDQKKADAKKAGDAAHQMRLANTIKTLEMCGGSMTQQEVEGLIEPLKFDANAKWPILAALKSAGVKGFGGIWKEELFAHHARRDLQIGELEKLSVMLSGFWKFAEASDDLEAFTVRLKLAGIKDKLSDFDEDLVYQG